MIKILLLAGPGSEPAWGWPLPNCRCLRSRYGWGILIPKPGSPYAGESIPMHGGEIFGFQSMIQRIPAHKELIVLLENTDSPKLLDIALQIRNVLANYPER